MQELMSQLNSISIDELKAFLSAVSSPEINNLEMIPSTNIQNLLAEVQKIYQYCTEIAQDESGKKAAAKMKEGLSSEEIKDIKRECLVPVTEIISQLAKDNLEEQPIDALLKIHLLKKSLDVLEKKERHDAIKNYPEISEEDYNKLESKFYGEDSKNYSIYEIVEEKRHSKLGDNYNIYLDQSLIITPDEYNKIKQDVEANTEYMTFWEHQLKLRNSEQSISNHYASYQSVLMNASFAIKNKIFASANLNFLATIIEEIKKEITKDADKNFFDEVLTSYPFVRSKGVQKFFESIFDSKGNSEELGIWYSEILVPFLTSSSVIENIKAKKPEERGALESVFATTPLANIAFDDLKRKFKQVENPSFGIFYFDYIVKNISEIYQDQMNLHLQEIESAASDEIRDRMTTVNHNEYVKALVRFANDCSQDQAMQKLQTSIFIKNDQRVELVRKKKDTSKVDQEIENIKTIRNNKIEDKLNDPKYVDLKSKKEKFGNDKFYTHYDAVREVRRRQADLVAKEFIAHIKNHIINTDWGKKFGYKELVKGKGVFVPANVKEIYTQCVDAENNSKWLDHLNEILHIGKEASENRPKFLFFTLKTRTEKTQEFYDKIRFAALQAEEIQEKRNNNNKKL